MEKSIVKRIKELADQMEQLSIDVAHLKQTADPSNISVIQELSDELFCVQSKMRYEYYYLAQGIWED